MKTGRTHSSHQIQRATALVKHVKKVADHYEVHGHVVTEDYSCDCLGFVYNKDCSHLLAVKFFKEKQNVSDSGVSEDTEDEF